MRTLHASALRPIPRSELPRQPPREAHRNHIGWIREITLRWLLHCLSYEESSRRDTYCSKVELTITYWTMSTEEAAVYSAIMDAQICLQELEGAHALLEATSKSPAELRASKLKIRQLTDNLRSLHRTAAVFKSRAAQCTPPPELYAT
jgi:hypothetical protein